MAIDGEILTIHEKIAQAHKDNLDNFGMGEKQKKIKIFDAPKVSDIEEIKQVLNYILDKLHSMDQYIRGHGLPKQKIHEGEMMGKSIKDILPTVKQLNNLVDKELTRPIIDAKPEGRLS